MVEKNRATLAEGFWGDPHLLSKAPAPYTPSVILPLVGRVEGIRLLGRAIFSGLQPSGSTGE